MDMCNMADSACTAQQSCSVPACSTKPEGCKDADYRVCSSFFNGTAIASDNPQCNDDCQKAHDLKFSISRLRNVNLVDVIIEIVTFLALCITAGFIFKDHKVGTIITSIVFLIIVILDFGLQAAALALASSAYSAIELPYNNFCISSITGRRLERFQSNLRANLETVLWLGYIEIVLALLETTVEIGALLLETRGSSSAPSKMQKWLWIVQAVLASFNIVASVVDYTKFTRESYSDAQQILTSLQSRDTAWCIEAV